MRRIKSLDDLKTYSFGTRIIKSFEYLLDKTVNLLICFTNHLVFSLKQQSSQQLVVPVFDQFLLAPMM